MATTHERGLGRQWQLLRVRALLVYGPTCHLCHGGIDPAAPARTAQSYSLDHLDARSVYGTAIPDISRVRPSHLGCNSQRGEKTVPTAAVYSSIW